jgi:prophage regulatory protein
MTRYLRISQLASTPARPGRLPIAPATIWRWAAADKFPRPVRLSAGITAWTVESVERWEAERASQEARAL